VRPGRPRRRGGAGFAGPSRALARRRAPFRVPPDPLRLPAGDHALLPDSVYGPSRQLADELLRRFGLAVSPDDCALALRGLQTLGVRLAAVERSARRVAAWLAEQPGVAAVLHPALPSCPGYATWARDFTGATGVFSVAFAEGVPRDAILAFVDALTLFGIGHSWGGTHSLVVPYLELPRTHGSPHAGRLVRFSVGLEEADDLVADLRQALGRAGIVPTP
jgi:cysteine-S-conjugate beta-lyase